MDGTGAAWALTNTGGNHASLRRLPTVTRFRRLRRLAACPPAGSAAHPSVSVIRLIARCVFAAVSAWAAQRPAWDCRSLAARCVRFVAGCFPHLRSAAECGAWTPTDYRAADPDLRPFCRAAVECVPIVTSSARTISCCVLGSASTDGVAAKGRSANSVLIADWAVNGIDAPEREHLHFTLFG